MTDQLLEKIEDRVAVLTMNRPEALNALSDEMMDALSEATNRLKNDDDVGCIVLTGAGRGFCSGGDVKGMAGGTGNSVAPPSTMEMNHRKLRRHMQASIDLHEMTKPTIAMVKGPAAGAGLSLALACDIRICGESARMTTAFARVGLAGDFGGTYFLPRIVGDGKARELYFTAAMVEADEALRLGIANRIVPDDKLEEETMALASQLAHGPGITLGYMKRNLNTQNHQSLSELMDQEITHHLRSGQTADMREAATAFVEKRTPVFKQR